MGRSAIYSASSLGVEIAASLLAHADEVSSRNYLLPHQTASGA